MSCTEWGNATLINVPWIETDWDDPPKCSTCAHLGDLTVDDVACCNCCENYSFYEPRKENKMTKLEQFIQDRLDRVKRTSDIQYQDNLFHQAFGAVEFACSLYPEHETEIAEWWNNNKWNEFWDIIGD